MDARSREQCALTLCATHTLRRLLNSNEAYFIGLYGKATIWKGCQVKHQQTTLRLVVNRSSSHPHEKEALYIFQSRNHYFLFYFSESNGNISQEKFRRERPYTHATKLLVSSGRWLLRRLSMRKNVLYSFVFFTFLHTVPLSQWGVSGPASTCARAFAISWVTLHL